MSDSAPTRPNRPSSIRTALVLIAHGSRNAQANDDLFHLAEEIRQQKTYAFVEPAFLELAEPTIEAAGASCARHGARRVVLLPYFLSAGVHVRKDLFDIRQVLADHHPEVEFLLAEPLGRHPALFQVVLDRACEAESKTPK